MKNKKIILTGFLVLAIVATFVSPNIYANAYSKASSLFASFFEVPEEKVYQLKVQEDKEVLINEIRELDDELRHSENKIVAVPHALALIEKADEFETEEVLKLLEQSNDSEVFETALVEIYIKLEGDSQKLLSLFYDSNLSVGAKENIIIKADLPVDELKNICMSYDNTYSVIAMKKLAGLDVDSAYELSEKILSNHNAGSSENDLYMAALGIERYFSKNSDDYIGKADIIKELKKQVDLIDNSKENLTRDRLVYALSKSQDFETFKYLIFNETIDEDLKVTAIENNLEMILKMIESGLDEEEKECVLASMEIFPILEVGEALERYYDNRFVERDTNVLNIIEHIRNNGVKGVFKNE